MIIKIDLIIDKYKINNRLMIHGKSYSYSMKKILDL